MEGYKEIIITREKSPWGCAVDFTVLLDDKVVGILRNGASVSACAQDGPHTLSFQKGRKIDCSTSILISPDDTAKVVNTAISGSHLVIESEYGTNTPETSVSDSENALGKRSKKIKGNVAFAAVIVVAIIAAVSLTFGGRTNRPSNAGSDILAQSTITKTNLEDENDDADISNLIFGPGTYTVGTDIPAGTYDCVAVSGFGVLRGDVASLGNVGFVQTMGTATSEIGNYSANVSASNSYSNLKVENGDVLYIEMTLNVKFVPA